MDWDTEQRLRHWDRVELLLMVVVLELGGLCLLGAAWVLRSW